MRQLLLRPPIAVAVCFWLAHALSGQSISFRSLGTEQGMRTLTSWHCTYDGFGHLWVSTSDGLVRYNGNEVTYYYTQTHPELPSDPTGYLFCDSQNNLWICTPKGLTKANPNRLLERQVVYPEEPNREVNFCVEDSRGYITAFSRGQCFQQQSPGGPWIIQPWMDSILAGERIRDIRRFNEDSYLIIMPRRGISLINLKTQMEMAFFPLPGVSHAGRLDDSHIVISATGPFTLFKAALQSPEVLVPIAGPSFFLPGDVSSKIEHLTMASNGRLYLATDGAGLVQYDFSTSSYHQYKHDAANPFSIAENSLRYIIADSFGNIAFSSLSGVNFGNVRAAGVEYLNYFKTASGEILDDRVISIAEDTLRQLWVVMENGVVVISPDLQKITMLDVHSLFAEGEGPPSFLYATADRHGHIWVAIRQKGIAVFNPDIKLMKFLSATTYPGYGNAVERIRLMKSDADDFMYVGAENGLFRIHQKYYTIDTFPDAPNLQPLRTSRIVDIMPEQDALWVSTSPGGAAWQYVYSTGVLKKYSSAEGLLSDRVYALEKDNLGRIYIGSYAGLSILHPDGTIDNLSKGKGLPSTRIDAIERALDGTIWMTNTYNLLQYDPLAEKVIRIIGNAGFARVNYQIMASAVLSSSRLVFGAHKGLVIVNTIEPEAKTDSIRLFVFHLNASGHEFLCSADHPILLKSNEQLLRFSFGINNLLLADKMLYRYKLSKKDEGSWSEPSYLPKVEFNLVPGAYQLEVEVSDGNAWYAASGPFRIKINFPWWRRWWVISFFSLVVLSSIWIYNRGRIEKYKKDLSIAREIADLESKALRAQMNPHFVFNSLNAIQECIVTGKVDEAYAYLSQFSRLLRFVLEHSDVTSVSLHEELEVLSLFVSLEKLRFKNDMQFLLSIDEALDAEEIWIPPMLIQPHLENAIWHGLRNKEGERILKLDIQERIPGYLNVCIEDNGIGRMKAEELRQKRLGGNSHRSKGKQLSGNRLELLANHYPHTTIIYSDLYDAQGMATGTKVQLNIPIVAKDKPVNP